VLFVATAIGGLVAVSNKLRPTQEEKEKNRQKLNELEESWKFENQYEVRVCVEKGGVPVRSGWTGGLKRCDFPNN
jgi:hypothetical protein